MTALLHVDDQKLTVNRIAKLISRRDIIYTQDFEGAANLIITMKPKVLILDLHNENGISGLDVLKQIASLPAKLIPRIIIHSGEHAARIRDSLASALTKKFFPKNSMLLN